MTDMSRLRRGQLRVKKKKWDFNNFILKIYNLFNSCFFFLLFFVSLSLHCNLLFLCFCSPIFFLMLPPFNLHFAAPGILNTNSMKTCIVWLKMIAGELLIILHYFDVNEFFDVIIINIYKTGWRKFLRIFQ